MKQIKIRKREEKRVKIRNDHKKEREKENETLREREDVVKTTKYKRKGRIRRREKMRPACIKA